MKKIIERMQHKWAAIDKFIWRTEFKALPKWQQKAITIGRLLAILRIELQSEALNFRAASLVYSSLLSIVPLIAIVLSMLKAIGLHEQLEPLVYEFLTPLGDQGKELGQQFFAFINQQDIRVIGSAATVFLLFLAISIIRKVEINLNQLWHCDTTRSVLETVVAYLAIIIIGPVLLFLAMGITASFTASKIAQSFFEYELINNAFNVFGLITPLLIICAALTFFYSFLPNTRVHFLPALTGAAIASVAWKIMGIIFAGVITTSANYNAVFSSFAIIILFFMWLYYSWLIFLIGAKIAYFNQNHVYIEPPKRKILYSFDQFEAACIAIFHAVAQVHWHGRQSPSSADMETALSIPNALSRRSLACLIDGHFVLEASQDPVRYVPARALENSYVGHLLHYIRQYSKHVREINIESSAVQQICTKLAKDYALEFEKMNWKDVVLATPADTPNGATPSSGVNKKI